MLLVLLHLALERAIADDLVADEVDCLILTSGPSSRWKVRCTSFGPPGMSLISWRDLRVLEPLLLEHVADDAFDLSNQAGIDEGVEADLGAFASFSFSSIFAVSMLFEPT